MKLYFYAELQDSDNDIVDVYGYKDRVLVWTLGYCKEYLTNSIKETSMKVNFIVERLENAGFAKVN